MKKRKSKAGFPFPCSGFPLPFSLFSLLLCAFLFGACGGRKGPGLLLITVDTLRADHLGCYGYRGKPTPQIDRLAADGVLFSRAFTPMPVTGPSHAALLTGKEPIALGLYHNGVPIPEGVKTLADRFSEEGVNCAGFVSAFPVSGSLGFSRGFSHFDDEASDLEGRRFTFKGSPAASRKGEETVTRALAWLKGIRGYSFFCWIHLWDPHRPYTLHPEDEGGERGRNFAYKGQVPFFNMLNKKKRPPTEQDREDVAFLYDSEVSYVDRQIGRLIQGLEEMGLYRDTCIVFAADHGEALGEHGQWALHRDVPYDHALRIPLIVSWPSRLKKGVTRDALICNTDLAPDLPRLLLAKQAPAGGNGYFLKVLTGEEGEKREVLFHESVSFPGNEHEKQGFNHVLRNSRWKYIYFQQENREELYDMDADPLETVNLAKENGEVCASMKKQLQSQLKLLKDGPGKGPAEKEIVQMLKSLGYYEE